MKWIVLINSYIHSIRTIFFPFISRKRITLLLQSAHCKIFPLCFYITATSLRSCPLFNWSKYFLLWDHGRKSSPLNNILDRFDLVNCTTLFFEMYFNNILPSIPVFQVVSFFSVYRSISFIHYQFTQDWWKPLPPPRPKIIHLSF
jgi:hypothetical protein